MAEHGLCGIWCRLGTPIANEWLRRGSDALGRNSIEEAITCFDAAIVASPTFADAYNQRGLSHFVDGRPELTLLDCQTCVRLEPDHFVAWAGIGHAHAALNDAGRAAEAYREALAVNPGLHCVSEMLAELEGVSNIGRDTGL